MAEDPRFATLSRRLLARPRPGAWLGLVVRAFPAADGLTDGSADGPPHYLVAGWRAGEDGVVPRLPEFAAIASPDRERALAELLVHLPPDAPVHLITPGHVDAALVAEMVLEVDRHLQPWHRDGLRAFADAQREADRARIRARYTDREAGYERMWRSLVGRTSPPAPGPFADADAGPGPGQGGGGIGGTAGDGAGPGGGGGGGDGD